MTAFSKPFHFSPRQENIQSNVNVNFDEIASYINARNDGTATWDAVSAVTVTVTGAAAAPPAANTIYKDNIVKGWISMNGTGTIAVADSFNVTSITDNGTGDYTITWDRDFANVNYAISISGGSTDAESWAPRIGPVSANPITHIAVGSVRVCTFQSSSNASVDSQRVLVIGIGDQ